MTDPTPPLPTGVRKNRDAARLGATYYEPIDPDDMDAALVADEMNIKERRTLTGGDDD